MRLTHMNVQIDEVLATEHFLFVGECHFLTQGVIWKVIRMN
nr:MAG TPA: hypothetical protein [Caudoviricetes sp.]